MPVFLFDEIIFGPVKSRRLGVSLGINLLPLDYKYCNFDCIYCECGRTFKNKFRNKSFNDRNEIKKRLEDVLNKMKAENNPPDYITFAGNGEPSMHPDFKEIINDTVELRNKLFPEAKIAVLSNATLIHKKEIFEALNKVDENILKLDSAFDDKIKLLNNPPDGFSVKKLTKNLMKFNGKLIIQTMLVSGTYKGENVDNTSIEETEALIKLYKKINPEKIMIYTIERDTPSENLKKVKPEKLYEIAEIIKREGFKVQVSV